MHPPGHVPHALTFLRAHAQLDVAFPQLLIVAFEEVAHQGNEGSPEDHNQTNEDLYF